MLPVFRNTPAVVPTATNSFNRLESLFNSLAGDDGGFQAQAWSRFPMTMWVDDDQYHVEADLPGVSEADVDVTIHNDTLIIRGERKAEEGRQYLYNGRWFGRFERAVTLPEAVDADAVNASFTDGVLRIDLPKRPESKPKKITLKAKGETNGD